MACFNSPRLPIDPRNLTKCGSSKNTTAPDTLQELIDEYLANEQETQEVDNFASMSSLGKVLQCAGMAENGRGKRYSHQNRLKHNNMARGTTEIFKQAQKIAACDSFDDLHAIVSAITSQISGLGPLYTYDTARRIGAKLGKEPDRVYLHAGTRKGAKALGLNHRRASLPMSDFPTPLRKLRPDMLESFLCIYKDKLGKFAAR